MKMAKSKCSIPATDVTGRTAQIAHRRSDVLVCVAGDYVAAAPSMNTHVVIVETSAVMIVLRHAIHVVSSVIIAQKRKMQPSPVRIALKLFAMVAGVKLQTNN